MKKYVILSVNENQDYLYFLPLTMWTWKYFGWEPLLLYTAPCSKEFSALQELAGSGPVDYFAKKPITKIDGIRNATLAQVSRLYASSVPIVNDDDYLMLGDIDMLALSNNWNPDYEKVTVWNHDLTGFGEVPMCYVGMKAKLWRRVMDIKKENINESISDCLLNYDNAKEDDFYKWWGCDQQILTDRLKKYGFDKITFINRGTGSHGYARGRVDRAPGGWIFNQPELIDAHLMQQTHHSTEKINKLYDLLHYVWPNEDFMWFRMYTEKYRELTGHKG